MAPSKTQSVVNYYRYQREFFEDDARILVGIWTRQGGKDFTTAWKAVDHAFATGEAWYIVSLTQRQADATFAKCRQAAKAFRMAYASVAGEVREENGEPYYEYDPEIDHHFRCVARTLHLPGGGTVTSLPGRDPDTLAGLTGNVIFTEFGLFPKGGYAHWRVIFPLITRGHRIIVISTPRGKNHKFHELVQSPEKYSVHRVDIHRAVADGMPLHDADGNPCTPEQLRELYGDPVGWGREYLLDFSGDLSALVKWGQLVAAGQAGRDFPAADVIDVTGEAGGWPADLTRRIAADLGSAGRMEWGWDVARHRDLSALWGNLASPGRCKALRLLVLMRNVTFARQREIIRQAMKINPRNVGCGDATGLGMDSNETLSTEFPGRWEGLTFTAAAKRELGSLLVTAFEDQAQAIPPTDGPHKYVATDLYAVQNAGDRQTPKLTETENPLLPESHCDIAYAGALALKAAQLSPPMGHVWVG